MFKHLKKLAKSEPKFWFGIAVILLVIAGGLWLAFVRTNDTATIPSSSPTKTVSSNSDKQLATAPNSSNPTGSGSGSTKSSASSTGSSSGAPPTTPYGDFVSNHSPGGSNPTQETSVCDTTPGASCYIQFTQGGTTKSLASQTADANGAVYWNWDAAILSSGSWTVKAAATLNGQTRSSTDSRPLVVP